MARKSGASRILSGADDAAARKEHGYTLGEPISAGTISIDRAVNTVGAAGDVTFDQSVTPTSDDTHDQPFIVLADGSSTFAPDFGLVSGIPTHPPWSSADWTAALDSAFVVVVRFMRPTAPSRRHRAHVFRPKAAPQPRRCEECGCKFTPKRSDQRFHAPACRLAAFRRVKRISQRLSRGQFMALGREPDMTQDTEAEPVIYTATVQRIRPGDADYAAARTRLDALSERAARWRKSIDDGWEVADALAEAVAVLTEEGPTATA